VDTALDYSLRGKKDMPAAVFQAESQVQSNSLQPVQCVDPAACITGTPRIWVVYVDHLASDPFSAVPWNEAALLGILGYQAQAQYQENGITVALLTT
jgi:mannosyltransferase